MFKPMDKKIITIFCSKIFRAANECWRSSFVFGLSICLSVRGHSNSVIFNRISSKFHIWIASTNLSLKLEYRFCLTSDNQDGRQNGRHLSISAVLVTLTQSFLIGFLPNSYMNCFHHPFVQVQIWVLSNIQ